MHISPINISVHTTNPELRCRMMGNRFAGEKLAVLRRFADAGLAINCQLVLVPRLQRRGGADRHPAGSGGTGPGGEKRGRRAGGPDQIPGRADASAPVHPGRGRGTSSDRMEAMGDEMLQKHWDAGCSIPPMNFIIKAGLPMPDAAYLRRHGPAGERGGHDRSARGAVPRGPGRRPGRGPPPGGQPSAYRHRPAGRA